MIRWLGRLALGALVLIGLPVSAGVVITEFMANNDGVLPDQDGQSPDWIELRNQSNYEANLGGWRLTDDAANLAKWTFPATNLPPGGILVVFASGKDRAVAGAELHTSFQLNRDGGYLALVQPDSTIAQAITYPAQRRNLSYGLGRQTVTNTVLALGSSARVLVPTNEALGLTWTQPGFDDSVWLATNTPVAYSLLPTTNVVLALDVNDRDNNIAANTQPGFTGFVIGNVGGTAPIQTGSVTRTFGAISVTLSNSSPAIGYDDRLRGTPANSGTFTESLLLRDFVFSRDNSGTSGLDLSLTGLLAARNYVFTIWSFDALSPGSRISDWYANGIQVVTNYTFSGSVLPSTDGAGRFSFNVTADAGGRVLIAGRRDTASVGSTGAADFGVFLNALQIAELGAPAATTNGLAGLMYSNNATAYVRIPFNIANPETVTEFSLRARYNDGFVAYLNGQVAASRNAPATLAWNSTATARHADAGFEDIPLLPPPGLLVAGTNWLAVQVLNVAANDADLFFLPELLALQVTETPGRFFTPATPGEANAVGYPGFVADTKFSVDRGFYDTPFSLSITCATAGAEIWYTTNGNAPGPSNGFLYSAPISIAGQSFIRAAAFLSGYIPSDIDTHSYLFLTDVLRQSNSIPGYPSIWTQASYPADYAMDPAIVNDPVYGATISNDLRSIPSLSIVMDQASLWNSSTGIYPNPLSSGPTWERPTSVELIRGDGHTKFATTCRIQLHGNASRDNQRTPKHAFGLNFNSDYGPAKLHYDWFGGGVDAHDKIVLRNCGFVDGWAGRYADENLHTSAETGEQFRGLRYRPENTCYLRDSWVKDSFRAMGWTASRSQYVHLYLNGLYWGLYEPSEHVDASYFSLHQGGLENAWDVIVGEDNNGPPVIVDGSVADWNNVLTIVNAGITNDTAYQTVDRLVDLDNLIDYMMLHIFAESEDWPRHNWYVAHRHATNGVPGTKFFCTVWDQELTLDRLVRRNRIDVGGAGGEVYSPARIYQQLRAWPEFRLRFGDRVQKHLFNGGALTPSNTVTRLLASASVISNAVVGESARWGDARKFPTPGGPNGTGNTFTRNEWWQPEIDKLATNFLQKLTADNVARFRAGGLYPNLSAPEFSQFGGAVPAGFDLAISHTNASGAVYFTVDGSDPRVYGTSAVSPAAQAYADPIPINTPTLVRARVLNGAEWSALVETMFYPPQDLSKLALTEIMYNPPAQGTNAGDEFEFIELKNTGTNILNLSGLQFTDGISYGFTNGALLVPGSFCLLVRNPDAFALKYPGVPASGVYTGKLDNGGERLTLAHVLGSAVFSVTYSDKAPWPVTGDNWGYSLVPKFPGLYQAPDDGAKWRASALPGGSPGTDDSEPSWPRVVINEVLTASEAPLVDFIELQNLEATNVNLGGWFLTDSAAEPFKYRLPDNTIIPAGGFLVFDEQHFNTTPGTNGSFSLSAQGEQVYLFSGDAQTNLTGYSHGFHFDAAAAGVSFGRYVNSVGEEQFPAQLTRTPGGENIGPRVGPVVINEIMYHAPTGQVEFVELKNISSQPVAFFDTLNPSNSWRLAGLDFAIPTNVVLEPGGYLLLAATNADSFRAQYAVPTNVLVLGPYLGALQDSGERLSLERPGPLDTNGFGYIVVDAVRYNDKAPWPASADGGGDSLQRRNAAAYADDPINWFAAPPTPGRPNAGRDSDGDGLPDEWETAHGLVATNSADANLDSDGDGLSNLQEFAIGTDPFDPKSVLELELVATGTNSPMALTFVAPANVPFIVLASTNLPPTQWIEMAEIPASPTNRVVTFPIPDAMTARQFITVRARIER